MWKECGQLCSAPIFSFNIKTVREAYCLVFGLQNVLEVFTVKKTIVILLSLSMILGLTACGKSADRVVESAEDHQYVC